MWTQSTARLTVHETFCANCGFGSAAIRVVASDPIGTIRAFRSRFDRERVRVVGESRQENKEKRLILIYFPWFSFDGLARWRDFKKERQTFLA